MPSLDTVNHSYINVPVITRLYHLYIHLKPGLDPQKYTLHIWMHTSNFWFRSGSNLTDLTDLGTSSSLQCYSSRSHRPALTPVFRTLRRLQDVDMSMFRDDLGAEFIFCSSTSPDRLAAVLRCAEGPCCCCADPTWPQQTGVTVLQQSR